MTDRTALGEFEHHVLLAVLRLGNEAFTAPIVEELESRTGRSVAPAAVYIALRRLEKRGLVASDLRTDDSAGSKRERRFVQVTEAAIRQLREARTDFHSLWDGLDALGEAQS
ncbi:PadR family transcriptional regulator [Gaopeijia maritima]|uniref:Helix-turn-helix transcriptional regulator n=1 Tax=Gaopeijia maritima TaxID=3119007 RepID=A0ABU9E6Z3_9BACT